MYIYHVLKVKYADNFILKHLEITDNTEQPHKGTHYQFVAMLSADQ